MRPDSDAPWSVLSLLEQSILDKMRAKGTPLTEWDVKIHVGILTGLNKAFIISDEVKKSLVSATPGSEKVIKPLLRGRDIQRFRAPWANIWLIDAHNGYGQVPPFDANDHPAIKAHLDRFYSDLAKRREKGRTPYNVRDCAYHEELTKEKLVWIDLAERGRFAYDNSGMLCLNTAFFMSGKALKYLCAILNSTLVTWLVRNTALNSGMGTARWIRGPVERIPIPKISAAKQRPSVRLVDEILAAKATDPEADTQPLEWAIDRLVYDLYDLTEEERTAIERSLRLSPRHRRGRRYGVGTSRGGGIWGPEPLPRVEVMEILRAPDGD